MGTHPGGTGGTPGGTGTQLDGIGNCIGGFTSISHGGRGEPETRGFTKLPGMFGVLHQLKGFAVPCATCRAYSSFEIITAFGLDSPCGLTLHPARALET